MSQQQSSQAQYENEARFKAEDEQDYCHACGESEYWCECRPDHQPNLSDPMWEEPNE